MDSEWDRVGFIPDVAASDIRGLFTSLQRPIPRLTIIIVIVIFIISCSYRTRTRLAGDRAGHKADLFQTMPLARVIEKSCAKEIKTHRDSGVDVEGGCWNCFTETTEAEGETTTKMAIRKGAYVYSPERSEKQSVPSDTGTKTESPEQGTWHLSVGCSGDDKRCAMDWDNICAGPGSQRCKKRSVIRSWRNHTIDSAIR